MQTYLTSEQILAFSSNRMLTTLALIYKESGATPC
jgi:hypothetical protein